MARQKRPRHDREVHKATSEGHEKPEAFLNGVLYDSDVIIEILRARPKIVEQARRLEASGVPTFCTPISWAEVFAGIRAGEEPLTEGFFQARGQLEIDSVVGRRAGAYMARYSKSHSVELADALVAATATINGLWLWTLNRKHYPMPDLKIYEAQD